MKRDNLQSQYLPAFRGYAVACIAHICMPAEWRNAVIKAIRGVRLPLTEVIGKSKGESWCIYVKRVISGAKAVMPTGAEKERILKELQIELNQRGI